MKYMLAFLLLAVSSTQVISEDFGKEINYLRDQVDEKLEKLIQPLLHKGQELLNKLEKMKEQVTKLNPNTPQCKEFEATLKKDQDLVQQINVAIYKTALKIKQDVIDIKTECSSQSLNFFDIIKCVKQNTGVVLKDVQNLQPTVLNYLQEIKGYSKDVTNEFQQCLKSQTITTAKPTV